MSKVYSSVYRTLVSCREGESKVLVRWCSAGRDAKFFLENGCRVDVIDGSEKLCEIAGAYAGIRVHQMLFSELSAENCYDGIWACSSILHLPIAELENVFSRMVRAVKQFGHIYTSFKYGEFEGYRGERYFTDFTERTFDGFISRISGLKILEEWISADVRPGRGDVKWLNLIQKKI